MNSLWTQKTANS